MATETPTTPTADDRPNPLAALDPAALAVRGVIVVLILIGSLFVWRFARSAVAAPFDSIVTEQACRSQAEELERKLVDFERSNRFGLRDRAYGSCLFGPVEGGTGNMRVDHTELEFGTLYRLAKAAGIITQLFIVSIFLRLVVDPAMDLYRSVVRLMNRS